MPDHTIQFDAILFDMDGTLINSTPAVNAVWQDFADKYDLDLDSMLSNSHGVQTHMTFRRYLPHLSEEQRSACFPFSLTIPVFIVFIIIVIVTLDLMNQARGGRQL